MKYSDLFHEEKPVFGMLHLSTPQGMTLLELARRETECNPQMKCVLFSPANFRIQKSASPRKYYI